MLLAYCGLAGCVPTSSRPDTSKYSKVQFSNRRYTLLRNAASCPQCCRHFAIFFNRFNSAIELGRKLLKQKTFHKNGQLVQRYLYYGGRSKRLEEITVRPLHAGCRFFAQYPACVIMGHPVD